MYLIHSLHLFVPQLLFTNTEIVPLVYNLGLNLVLEGENDTKVSGNIIVTFVLMIDHAHLRAREVIPSARVRKVRLESRIA